MTDFRTFPEFFETLDVKHFRAEEFTEYFATRRRGVTNSTPPREIWGNITPTIRIVDALRAHFGRPIVLLSSYRSPAYNAAIGDAAPKSFHMQFKALDIAVSGKTPRQVFAVLDQWRKEGKFKGGLGLYSTFVHIDTRGNNATWGDV
ncbi:DUF882 domain-containing protein [Luteolibacter yonseiensis]|uniref:DUF882 domain-containing protein n=1 Tax=Luteolibacter yonseiensis TaxID=1144680 RepID=A0A934R7J0_9BACT|nr:D-Ala-D-Ala carboxypeptidase family metallohydrolase [Luteolibacter yonseiensis]MBK1816544.1 DUF882 domain-containing protein [Luteolibacter yonseiensis]